jgi:hypothetical protein
MPGRGRSCGTAPRYQEHLAASRRHPARGTGFNKLSPNGFGCGEQKSHKSVRGEILCWPSSPDESSVEDPQAHGRAMHGYGQPDIAC